MGTTIQTTQLIIDSIVGDISRGGWEASASLLNAQGYADYGRRAESFWLPEGNGIWQDDWLLGLRGCILPRSIEWDRGQSRTEIMMATSHIFLENAGLQGIYFTTDVPPTGVDPHYSPTWTLGGIVKHIVEQHTNISSTGFVQNSDGSYTTTPIGGWVDTTGIDTVDSTSINYYTVHESNSMWSTLQSIGENEFYVPYFTKRDELIYKVHPMFAPALPEPVMEIDNRYMIGQPRVNYRDDVIPDQVQLYALTDGGEILKSNYPESIATDGRRHKVTNIRCNDQDRLNELAQRLYLFLQRRYEIAITIHGPWGLLMEMYDRIEVTYDGTVDHAGVGFVWNQKKFWISRISVRRVHDFGAITELTLDEESYGEGYFYTDYT